jgi:hypothetical protein
MPPSKLMFAANTYPVAWSALAMDSSCVFLRLSFVLQFTSSFCRSTETWRLPRSVRSSSVRSRAPANAALCVEEVDPVVQQGRRDLEHFDDAAQRHGVHQVPEDVAVLVGGLLALRRGAAEGKNLLAGDTPVPRRADGVHPEAGHVLLRRRLRGELTGSVWAAREQRLQVGADAQQLLGDRHVALRREDLAAQPALKLRQVLPGGHHPVIAPPRIGSAHCLRARLLSGFGGTPKLPQRGFLQWLTWIPAAVGGNRGAKGSVGRPKKIFPRTKKRPSH